MTLTPEVWLSSRRDSLCRRIISELQLVVRQSFLRKIIERNDDDAFCSRQQKAWVESLLLVVFHVLHGSVLPRLNPCPKCLCILLIHLVSTGDATGGETDVKGSPHQLNGLYTPFVSPVIGGQKPLGEAF